MPHAYTRFPDEIDRVQDACEQMDRVLSMMIGSDDKGRLHKRDGNSLNALKRLVEMLSGVEVHGGYQFDTDLAAIGRMAAGQWLRRME